ncbi:hypothetical protein M514_01180, partial [Trichuris suis]
MDDSCFHSGEEGCSVIQLVPAHGDVATKCFHDTARAVIHGNEESTVVLTVPSHLSTPAHQDEATMFGRALNAVPHQSLSQLRDVNLTVDM